jgi:hypothetical protein
MLPILEEQVRYLRPVKTVLPLQCITVCTNRGQTTFALPHGGVYDPLTAAVHLPAPAE